LTGWFVLILAVIVSLALGVALAQLIFTLLFAVLRTRVRDAAARQNNAATTTVKI
jgi:hypothetical protein